MSEQTTDLSPVAQLKAGLQNEKVLKGIADVSPPGAMEPKRLLAMFWIAVQRTPDLANVTLASAIAALGQAATDGLNPCGGPNAEAYLIPRRISRRVGDREVTTLEACYQRGYRGLLRLARRSKILVDIDAGVYYEGEKLQLSYGPNAVLVHEPNLVGAVGRVLGAYCWWKIEGSPTLHTKYMPVEEIEKTRQRSQVPNSPAWRNDFAAMARKTVIRSAWAMLPWDDADAAEMKRDADDVIDLGAADVTATDGVPTEQVPSTPAVNAPLDAMAANAPPPPAEKTKRTRKPKEPDLAATEVPKAETVSMEQPAPTEQAPPIVQQEAEQRPRSGYKILVGKHAGKVIEEIPDDVLTEYAEMLKKVGGDQAEIIALELEVDYRCEESARKAREFEAARDAAKKS